LQLVDARTRQSIAEVRPTKAPHDTWRAAYVRIPDRAFAVVAHVTDPARWLAFSQPVEMPAISHAAWELVKNGGLILWISAGAAMVLGGVAVVRGVSSPQRTGFCETAAVT
jgi:hypothetical protein